MDASTAFDVICPVYKLDPDKATFISMAASRTSLTLFGTNYGLAVALRAAHMMTLTRNRTTGEGGAIASKSEGELSVSYMSGTSKKITELSMTHYGQQLEQMIAESTVMLGVTGGNDIGRNDTPYPS